MNILGINWGEHDSAASLLQDGHLVAAAEEERFNRIKHAPFAYPLRAARYCMQAGGIEPEDLDLVAFSFSPKVGLGRATWHAIRHFPKANFVALAGFVRRAWYVAPPAWSRYFLKLPASTRTVFVPHHLAHAASAFYCSDFDPAAVLIVDGMGEWQATSLYQASGNRIDSRHGQGLFKNAIHTRHSCTTQTQHFSLILLNSQATGTNKSCFHFFRIRFALHHFDSGRSN